MKLVKVLTPKARLPLAILVVSLVLHAMALPILGQDPSIDAAELAAQEAQLEEALEEALDGEHQSLHVWSSLLTEVSMLERIRANAESEGVDEPVAGDDRLTVEGFLDRWQRARPASGGPDLFRAFQIRDPEQRRAAVISLLDRYPDDPMVVRQAVQRLRQAGETERARAELERFAADHPEDRVSYSMLVVDAHGDETRTAEVLMRWADARPGDPELASAWVSSVLPEQEPEATERVLSAFFDRGPRGDAGLRACRDVLRTVGESFGDQARACIARIAGDPEEDERLRGQATSALVELAAADGDWSSLLTALDALEPDRRVRALISAASGMREHNRCGEKVDLLSLAAEALDDDGPYRAVGSALQGCSEVPAARALFATLLRNAPADAVDDVVRSWTMQVNGRLRGELPPEATSILEQRLDQERESEGVYAALDIAYQLGEEMGDKRLALLQAWQRQAPSSFRGEQTIDLANELVGRGELEAARTVLEQHRGYHGEVTTMLWELYRSTEGEERAARFAESLIESRSSAEVGTGHRLAARSALVRGDVAGAEEHYWKSLESSVGKRAVAIELLAAVASRGDRARVETTAERICEEARPMGPSVDVPACAAELLTRAGQSEAAETFLVAQAVELPSDPESLRELAATAKASGRVEIAERALRRLLEIDPRNEGSWTSLGRFLEERGRAEAVSALLEQSRERFSPPPAFLYRSAGRALTAAGEPRRAIEILLEARGTLPETEGGEWSRSWINHELRQAYARLGEASPQSPGGTAPEPAPSFPPPGWTGEEDVAEAALRETAEALYSGAGGRYDPDRAEELFARAASRGDLQAAYRLAFLRRGSQPTGSPEGSMELYRRSVREVERRAAEGESFAQYLVGTAALVGLGQPVDDGVARRWLERAAAQGEGWALHNLAWMAEQGRGLAAPDPVLALETYRRASETGNTRSMVDFARLAFARGDSEALCEEGVRWLERSARAGNARAAALLGNVLFFGRGECVRRDPKASLPWLEAAAATHQEGGVYNLGLALVFAGRDPGERARGVSLLERSVERPNAFAAETLAFLYGTGVGVPRDPERARHFMDEAARLASDGFPHLRRQIPESGVYVELVERGIRRLEAIPPETDPAAAALLARLYSAGLSTGEVDVGPEQTFELARRAALAGEPWAMRLLSWFYLHGEGVEKDEREGRRWRRLCAEAGNSFCMMHHANALIKGEGVEQDVRAGLVWLRRAGEAGNWWAVGDLGNLYDEGWQGVPRDPDEAARWKRRLAALGDSEAAGWLQYYGYR